MSRSLKNFQEVLCSLHQTFCSGIRPVSEMEETMLSVLRPSQRTSDRVVSAPCTSSRPPVDPSELPPDRLHVEMELSPDSQITLYGPLLNAFLCIKVWFSKGLAYLLRPHRCGGRARESLANRERCHLQWWEQSLLWAAISFPLWEVQTTTVEPHKSSQISSRT